MLNKPTSPSHPTHTIPFILFIHVNCPSSAKLGTREADGLLTPGRVLQYHAQALGP